MGRTPTVTIKTLENKNRVFFQSEVKKNSSGAYIPMSQEYIGKKVRIIIDKT